MVVIIGCAPSSGSTFLADLLDSTPTTACGVELNLFSNKNLYNFQKYKSYKNYSSPASSIYKIRNRLNWDRLHSYGLNLDEMEKIIDNSDDLQSFAENFAMWYFALRGKNHRSVLFEKTPENINCIGEFLEHFPESFFIHIVRNPLYVTASLLKRGFPPYIALGTWLIDEGKYLKFRESKNIIIVKYESLVAEPFKTVSKLIRKITGSDISIEELKQNYEKNLYRRFHSKKMRSWSINEYGVIANANERKFEKEELEILQCLWHVRINKAYAMHFDLEEISFVDAAEALGYGKELRKVLPNKSKFKCPVGLFRRKKLLFKWASDFLSGDASIFDLPIYLNPLVFNQANTIQI